LKLDISTFMTMAELSLAVIGFSAIVSALQRAQVATPIARISSRLLVEVALSAFALSMLPALFVSFGLSGTRLWQLCSLIGSVSVIIQISITLHRTRPLRTQLPGTKGAARGDVAAGVTFLIALANLPNAGGWPWPPSPGPYTALIMADLGAACLFFVQAFFAIAPPNEPTV
jgi:hypothetical protein